MISYQSKRELYESLQETLKNVPEHLTATALLVSKELQLRIQAMDDRRNNNANYIKRAEAAEFLGTYKDGSLRFVHYDYPDTGDSDTVAGWYYMDNDDESQGPFCSELACADALIKHLNVIGVTLKQLLGIGMNPGSLVSVGWTPHEGRIHSTILVAGLGESCIVIVDNLKQLETFLKVVFRDRHSVEFLSRIKFTYDLPVVDSRT